ncbi:putative membrane protein [Xenococcus sp. PCC 7305]|uniref:DoxX family protein n=1 Tax=Xenococcus sp. PCC 7305 TaxID=102125 RepID=UPI0002AC68AC|nr:DoxX family protein [Xenococcus sp. PCC 7305]ELS04050.1 putative membrane protein [Xenococcus sp. PCC 7305]
MTTSQTNNSLLAAIFQSNSSDNILFQIVWLVVRILASVLMIHNGIDKLEDVPGFAENVVAAIGLPFPILLTYCAAYAEIVGSGLLALGLFTRLSALSLVFTMLVAIYFHTQIDGFIIAPLETASLYCLSYLLFFVNGGGLFSVDTIIKKMFAPNADQ